MSNACILIAVFALTTCAQQIRGAEVMKLTALCRRAASEAVRRALVTRATHKGVGLPVQFGVITHSLLGAGTSSCLSFGLGTLRPGQGGLAVIHHARTSESVCVLWLHRAMLLAGCTNPFQQLSGGVRSFA